MRHSDKKVKDTPASQIQDQNLGDVLGEKYLAYALSTIMSRSLPDVRDGLKPVHRRLLWAMRHLQIPSTGMPKKSARVVGDVMGKYHPHGDVAIYEAMVRLAQDFSVRYPLVDGHGNFGNIDGDSAAHMRYTEARMTQVAEAMMEGLDDDAVDFRSTYDNSDHEPVVMPAAFPNLLANGASGIAVGMATSVPPHNVGELCAALYKLIENPDMTVDDLVSIIPGPDFPTGGVLVEGRDAIVEAYKTGRGSFRMRAKWEVEHLPQGQYQVVVTEIPYQVPKSRLVEKIAELLSERKLTLLDDVRDESSDVVRLVLVPKSRNVDENILMESLFKVTDLESKFSLNMNVLDKGVLPRIMDLKEVLQAFLEHRLEVLVRRSRSRLDRINHRLEVLAGLLVAYLNLDEVIAIIRSEDEPKPILMAKFSLTEVQAEAILNMRLRSLRKLEEMEIRKEHGELSAEKADVLSLLEETPAGVKRRWKVVGREIAAIDKKFGGETEIGRRRTEIAGKVEVIDIPLEAMVEKEPITIFCSQMGWVRAMKGHLTDYSGITYKDGDGEKFVLHTQTTDRLLLLATNGRFYTIMGDNLPRGRGFGEPVRLMVDLENEADITEVMVYEPGKKVLVAADDGRGFVISCDNVLAETRKGKQILNPKEGAKATFCLPVTGDHVAIMGDNRKLLVFPLEEIPEMARGQGVKLQNYKDGGCSDIKTFRLEDGLTWKRGEAVRTENADALLPWRGHRAAAGRLPPNGFPRSNKFS
ncbi:MAG TPA: DNA topoisomerase IV subunit A [Rhodospirillaceae bacterium]|nr:MAG: DNA topoisomerase IV subunit A [Alphaproteobacteria bacterium GWF2_58_20]HAU28845.1 DNA topoisomerase IV subunit A [Rhodospirillaceae bacterium]